MTSSPPRRRITLFSPGDNQDTLAVTDVLRSETVGGVLMLLAAVAALLWANLGGDSYETVRHIELGPLSLQHWAADGLLTIFFFVAGLELKREFVAGSLARPRQALVPIAAAVCGMVVPALIYLITNLVSPGGLPHGWGIPMATDIAFALAVLAVVAPKLPTSLRAFLLTLAIVDDLGAIVVIAVVFTASVAWLNLALAALCAVLWGLLQWRRIDRWWLHLPLFVACWWFTLESGVHATIAGVVLGLLTRTSPTEGDDPVDRWEHFWRPVSAGFAVPVFALASAGVAVSPDALLEVFTHPSGLGIILGLVVGKVLGVTGGAWLTAKLTGAQLHGGLTWREVSSIGVLAGIGFTVALLVADLAFAADPHHAERAKAAVLIASLIAAVLATVSLRIRTKDRARQGTLAD
ncbi:Na+/H+ antiporter NhaA [Propionibacteriaceae bacterium Y1685]|uniref:Na+/H+ antiporter NhaA n=1 Tax=Microlunatus sp. Y1700 TaxID=3418487 RepID=UPI003B7B49AD